MHIRVKFRALFVTLATVDKTIDITAFLVIFGRMILSRFTAGFGIDPRSVTTSVLLSMKSDLLGGKDSHAFVDDKGILIELV
ncbi:hypothetical protein OP10G_0155 [Fimbriimonas ginsengisoli Gsoil 348]|uniref:Uncharacterized protein n=1 Tax=Fimbriimonas ginsengisoli Gsoil 348 TaxID=661478 RepID=A0A068NIV9_FIMGI|nr:hypothetical protein OP10G_0155 [Fimbriimonas ginsengisoli Gsoil 348]